MDEEIIKHIDRCLSEISNIVTNDKYGWHDLRKNPNDLPELDSLIVCAFKTRDGGRVGYNTMTAYEDYLKSIKNQANTYAEYVAWKEIEPFKEESDD